MSATDTAFYLSGNYGPVADEVTAFDLPVIGELPAELNGRYLRNGPNPIEPVDPATTERGEKIKAELDDLLDEIDDVLETNAEDFVKSYVQKGGQ